MSVATLDPARNEAISSSAVALRRIGAYVLPPELDRRILELGERKDALTTEERDELQAWVKFTQQRSTEKFEAQLALRRLTAVFPEIAGQP